MSIRSQGILVIILISLGFSVLRLAVKKSIGDDYYKRDVAEAKEKLRDHSLEMFAHARDSAQQQSFFRWGVDVCMTDAFDATAGKVGMRLDLDPVEFRDVLIDLIEARAKEENRKDAIECLSKLREDVKGFDKKWYEVKPAKK